jgi:hypothetical protein
MKKHKGSISTVLPILLFTETPTFPLLSLDEIPTLHLPNLQCNDFYIDDFNFDIDNRQKWEDSLEATDIVSFDSCEDMPPLSPPRRDDSSSDDSYSTQHSKLDSSVDNVLYQLLQ